MEEDHTAHFVEAADANLELIHTVSECRDFLLHDGTVFYLTTRNTLVVPSEDEEYEFYGSILKIALHGHNIYLVFECSKILVFDALSREVATSLSGDLGGISKVFVASSGIYVVCCDGYLYKSAFENLRYVRQEMVPEAERHRISSVGADAGSIFSGTRAGAIYRDLKLLTKTFDRVELMVPNREHLYVVTAKGVLIRYNLREGRIALRIELGKVRVVGDSYILHDGVMIDLLRSVWMKVPRDTQNVVRTHGGLYIQTLSGIWGI